MEERKHIQVEEEGPKLWSLWDSVCKSIFFVCFFSQIHKHQYSLLSSLWPKHGTTNHLTAVSDVIGQKQSWQTVMFPQHLVGLCDVKFQHFKCEYQQPNQTLQFSAILCECKHFSQSVYADIFLIYRLRLASCMPAVPHIVNSLLPRVQRVRFIGGHLCLCYILFSI